MWRAALAILIVLAVDQASKAYVLFVLEIDRVLRIDVLPPVLNLRMAWNYGINFGIFGGHGQTIRFVLIALSVGISLWVWLWTAGHVAGLRQQGSARRAMLLEVSAGATIGGALGNALDRAVHGAVFDFLNTSCCGFSNPFVYNVADVMIFAGVAGLVAFSGPGTPRAAR
jgi:signal peptidase II